MDGVQKMRIKALISLFKKDIESGNFSSQAIIDRHLSAIEECKKEGINFKRIHERLDLDIKYPHFKTLLHRARLKVKSNTAK